MNKRNRNLCLWIVRENAKVTKLRLTYLRLAMFAMFFALIGGSLVVVAGDYARVQMLRFKNYVLLKQVEQERDSLAQSKHHLEGQMENLKVLNSKVMAYEQDVRQKLGHIGEIIESATSLGVIEEDQNSGTTEPLEGGVGGAEEDCTLGVGPSVCPSSFLSNSGLPPSLFPSVVLTDKSKLASLALDKLKNSAVEQDDDLLLRLDRYASFLKGLPLSAPAHGRISSGFGFRISPFSHHVSLHEGVDISLSQGTTIRSTGVGIVRQVANNPTYGLMVDVEHNDHLVTRYAHLSKTLVSENDKVSMGDAVGLAGSTGRSTGPHLHYEVRVDGHPKNPKSFLSLVNNLHSIL